MRYSLIGVTLMLVTGLAWATPAVGNDPPHAADDALRKDAQAYASDFNIELVEAIRRISLQGLIADIGAAIEHSEPETYAGHWIEHQPDFKVVVASTSADPNLIDRYFAGTGVESIVELRTVQHTRRQLVSDLQRLVAKRAQLDFDAEINVSANTVDVYVTDRAEFTRRMTDLGMALPSSARVLVVDGLSRPATAMYGGRPLREQSIYGNEICTSGFSVKSPGTGVHGLTTAAHCANNMTYELTGEVLTFVGQNSLTGYDIQWHRRADATFPNKAWDGSPDWRWVLGKRGRTQQSVGDYVCHWGRSTGSGCGNITSRDANLCNNGNGAVTGIRVHNVNNKDLSTGGDSGGPWYISDIALGTMSCAYWVEPIGYIDASYMAANYVETGLDVVIKTSP